MSDIPSEEKFRLVEPNRKWPIKATSTKVASIVMEK